MSKLRQAMTDALETIPFGPIAGVDISNSELFHLAPHICIIGKEITSNKKQLKELEGRKTELEKQTGR